MNPALIYAEQRMWAAVALQLIDDYESTLKRIHSIWFDKKVKVNQANLMTLRQLRREAKGEWLNLILEHINIHGDHLIAKLDKLDKQYNLGQIQFTIYDEDSSDKRKNLHIAR